MAAIDDVWLAVLTKSEDDAGSKNLFNLTINADGTDVFAHDFAPGANLAGQGSAGLTEGQAGLEKGEPPLPFDSASLIEDAGSDATINLTINADGEDVLDHDYGSNVGDGEAYVNAGSQLDAPFDSAALTNSSVRIGVRGNDAWAPGDILVFGHSRTEFGLNVAVPLAMETGLTASLSTDPSEGPLTVPLRLVGRGTSSTVIRRVLLLVHTQWATHGTDTGTDSAIQFEVFAGENLVLREEIDDTSQSDLEKATSNWYVMDAPVPFTRADVQDGGRMVLSILGDDAWKPQVLFVFGLDTASGRPSEVVSLVSRPVWGPRWMSSDTNEGDPSVDLPVSSG
jgi:hypothetical protein